jgi:molybdopterin converting factor small subunit
VKKKEHKMRVHVKLLSSLRELLPESGGEQDFELPDGANLRDLLLRLGFEKYFGEASLEKGLANAVQVLINQVFEGNLEFILKDGDEIVLIPPISGGMGTEYIPGS